MEYVRLRNALTILVISILALSLTLTSQALAASSARSELGSKGPGSGVYGEYGWSSGAGEKSCGPSGWEESSASVSPSLSSKVFGAEVGGRPLSIMLSGAEEVPGPGDEGGSGSAFLTFNPGQGLVCWELTAADIMTPTAAHIHEAAAGFAGPVVVTLSPPEDGSSSGCTSIDSILIKEIIQDPSGYYINIHNSEYPAGALRGQLSK